MKLRHIFALAILLLAGSTTYAQVKISAELRPRSEYNHGVKSPAVKDQNPSIITTQRTRLNLDFENEVFAVGMVMQDVRAWGSEAQLTANGNNVTYLHQAWAEWFMDENFSLKAGRQELAYDDHRILGNVGWAQQARSHDLALFKYTGDFNLHLGLAYFNQDLNNNIYRGPDAYKAMQFLWLNRQGDNYTASVLLLRNGVEYWKDAAETDQGIRYSNTLGTHIKTKLSEVSLAGNLYYQFGKDPSGNDISAFNFSIDASLPVADNANVGAGYELLTGTDADSDKNNSFAPLYGTNHKFNGFMDYFFVGNHFNSVGLNDIYLKGNIKPGKVKFNGAVHFFSAAADIPDKGLGTELDLWCGYNHKGQVQLDFGYSHMFTTDTMIALRGGVGDKSATHNWAWVMLTFKPTLFESKKD